MSSLSKPGKEGNESIVTRLDVLGALMSHGGYNGMEVGRGGIRPFGGTGVVSQSRPVRSGAVTSE